MRALTPAMVAAADVGDEMRRMSCALLSKAMDGATYVTSETERAELEKLALATEQAAQRAGMVPTWPECVQDLCHRWLLLATTRTAGSDILQQMGKQPALGTFRITQQFLERDGVLRCNNVITLGRSDAGLMSTWTLLPPGGQSSLKQLHAARVINHGESGGAAAAKPMRIAIELDSFIVDGNRAAGEPAETIVAANLPLPPPLPLPLPISKALEEAGTLDVTYLDERLRIVRAPGGVLRIFARLDEAGRMPTW